MFENKIGDGRIADNTVRHSGVERPFYSFSLKNCSWPLQFSPSVPYVNVNRDFKLAK